MGQRFVFTFVALAAGVSWYLLLQNRQPGPSVQELTVEPAFCGWAI